MTLGAGQAVGQGLSFLRNIILARIVSPADFGIAAILAMTVSLFEMASNVDVSIQLVQSPDGDEPRFQATAHSLEVLRGLLSGTLLALIAWPLSSALRMPEAAWAFFVLALYPLFRGFAHLDRARFQRTMRFAPFVRVDLVVNGLLLVAAWPLAAYLQSYAAMLWLLIAQSLLLTIGSHLTSERPYHWSWDSNYLRRLLSFGWPLLLNGILLFAIMQGDRAAIGAAFTMTDVGIYSAAFVITFVPTSMVFRVVGPIALPLLASVQKRPEDFQRRYALLAEALAVISTALTVPYVIAGERIMELAFGSQYTEGASVVAWLAFAQAVKTMRGAPTLAALSQNDPRNQLLSNVWRLAGVAAAVVVAVLHGPLWTVAAMAFVGEAVAHIGSSLRLRARHQIPVALSVRPALIAAAVCGTAWIVVRPSLVPRVRDASLAYACVTMLVSLALIFLCFPRVQHQALLALRAAYSSRQRTIRRYDPRIAVHVTTPQPAEEA